MRLNFGKYKGWRIDCVPDSYYQWLIKQDGFQKIKANVRRAICEYMKIEFIPNDNPFAGSYKGISKGKAIMDKNLKKSIENDDYNDKYK